MPARRPTKRTSSESSGRVPRHLPAHEVAVPGALFVGALAKRGVGDVARMNIGQLAHLRRNPSAPLALLRRRAAGAPHEVVGDEHPASLENVQQRHRPMFANERRRAVHLDHWQPPARGRDRVAFSCVRLLSNPQCVELGLKDAPVDDLGRSKLISHDVAHRSLRYIARRRSTCDPRPELAPRSGALESLPSPEGVCDAARAARIVLRGPFAATSGTRALGPSKATLGEDADSRAPRAYHSTQIFPKCRPDSSCRNASARPSSG